MRQLDSDSQSDTHVGPWMFLGVSTHKGAKLKENEGQNSAHKGSNYESAHIPQTKQKTK
jgi:hypothetical protein